MAWIRKAIGGSLIGAGQESNKILRLTLLR